MADNVNITPGSGNVVAADEVTDGTLGSVKVQYVKLMDGTLDGTNKGVITATGAVKTDGSAVTQPVSGTVTATGPLTDTQLRATPVPVSGTVTITPSGTQNVNVTNASGASAVNIQDGGNSITIDGTVAATQSGTWTVQPGNTANTTAWKVDGSAVTQPISAASLPLPSGASTAALQTQPGVDIGDVTVNNASGASAVNIQDGGNSITVDGTLTTTPPANASTNITQFGGTNVSTGTGASGAGIPRVTISNDSSLAANQSVNLAQVAGGTAITSGVTGSQAVGGDTASGSSDAGNPAKIGGVGRTTNPTAVTDGQRVNAIFDKLGKQVVVNAVRDLKGVQQTTITSSTAETTIITAVASTFLDLYGLIITNTSATVTAVTIKDSTAGTTRAIFEIPATDTRGFMLNASNGINQATVNNNWTATCGTSVASIEITALFVKNI